MTLDWQTLEEKLEEEEGEMSRTLAHLREQIDRKVEVHPTPQIDKEEVQGPPRLRTLSGLCLRAWDHSTSRIFE